MDVDFVIPLSKDDLLSSESGAYAVDEVISARSLPPKLADCYIDLRTDGPCSILRNFDVFFSLIRHFTDVDSSVREEAWQVLLNALSQLSSNIQPIIEQGDADTETRKTHLNTLKMICYLLTQMSESFEAEATKPTSQVTGKGRGKSAASKKKNSAGFDWEQQRERLVEMLGHLMQLDVNRLWDPPVVEEEFVNLMTGCCYKLLENPAVIRNKTTKDVVINLLGIVVKKYNNGLGASLKIVQLLQHFEHLVPHMAQAVDTIATEFGVKSIVSEIIREIGRMDPKDLARDTSGTRAYADFIVDLASRVPTLVLQSISMLMCHLDGESYSMRNGVLGVMAEIITKVLSTQDLDESAKRTRDHFLDRLEEHIHDMNAYVRSKVLQIWLHLCSEKCIPLPRQQHLLEMVIGRLHDKSSSVRKYAVQLLKSFLVFNPFGANLPLDHLQQKLIQETEKLKEIAPHLTQEAAGQVPVVAGRPKDVWKAMEPEVRATVQEHIGEQEIIDDDDGSIEFQGDVHEAFGMAMKRIKQLLSEGQHKKALAIMKAARVTWPNEEVLQPSHDQAKGDDDEAEESGEDEVETELGILKAVFLARDEGESPSLEDAEDANPTPESMDNQADVDNTGLVNDIGRQQVIVQYLKDYVSFQTEMERAVPVICQLLGSKTTTDVSEAIEFCVTAHEFGLRNAIVGVRRMLVLIWSRDAAVKEAVVEAYKGLYLDPPAQNARAKMSLIAKNLTSLTQGASVGDLTSLEELMVELMKAKLIPAAVVKLLWERFAMKVAQTTEDESRGALILLGMLAGAEVDIVRSNIDVLVSTGLGPRAKDDFLLARDTCVTLLKLVKTSRKRGNDDEPFRFPATHDIFERLTELITTGIHNTDSWYWVPMAEQAINVIYALSEHPDAVSETIIRKLATCLVEQAGRSTPEPSDNSEEEIQSQESSGKLMSCPSAVLARFLTVVGHVALRQLIHLDVTILREIKRRQGIQETEKEAAAKNIASVNTTKETTMAAEEEMGLTGATADDAEIEYIRKICELEIVTGQNLLSLLRPLIVCVVSNPSKFTDPKLQAAAALALAKFMLVSSEFCEAHLQLLFTILEKSPEATIRANTIVAIGDLTFRFPNMIEPWTSNLYARLRDESPHVRKNTMMVLTHLILNDMVKVKGNISEMATCLEDENKRIADLAKLFFHELAKKGNAVYNILPDIISRLSDPDCGIEEEPFRNILRYLLSFIQKDRQSESLVEKLCHRFRATRSDRQWRDLSFCLSLLSYNERAIRKLQENFGCFHDKLSDEDVHHSFMTIIGKAKKFAKPEVKALVDELEQRIDECHVKGMEDEEGYERASKASGVAATRPKKSVSATPAGKSTRSRKGRTPAARGRKKTVDDSDSEEESRPRSKRTPRNPPRIPKTKSSKRRPMPSFESDEDDSLDLFDVEEESDEENVNPNTQTSTSRTSTQEKSKETRPAREGRTRGIRT
ncbi:condensin complex subunit 1 [Nematostella vectensis]|uniref:condensin complex subunit 1 n=1 Tax=Nematostella vectensis TaxID=45351 RepID=UPI00138FA089|nr:condensin complex subunit 1 [Nematostella vectensis]